MRKMMIKIRIASVCALLSIAVQGEMYENEFPFIVREPVADSVVNLSFLNHRPAGKHGILKIRNGNFEFEDGVPVRWFRDQRQR